MLGLKRIKAVAACFFAMFWFMSPVQAAWQEVETQHFLIYGNTSPDKLLDKGEKLEAVHDLMRRALGLQSADIKTYKVKIYYVATTDDLQRLGHLPDYVGGYYRPRAEGPIAVVPLRGQGGSDSTLYHEYAHHFMLQYVVAAYPAWYVEGWAELISTSSFERKGAITYGKANNGRQYELDLGTWTHVRILLSSQFSQLKPEQREAFYGQSWLLTHFLTLDPVRSQQLRGYLAAINSGADFEKAAGAFGDLDQLDKDLRRYHANRSFQYKSVPLERDYAAGAKVRTLSVAETELIELAIEFTTPMKEDEAKKLLDKIRVATSHFPNDPYALELLSQAEIDLDNLDQADVAVGKWLAVAPNSARANYYRGAIILKRAENDKGDQDGPIAEARKFFSRAIEMDSRDPLAKVALYDSYVKMGERAPSKVVDGLVDAMYAVPQAADIRLRAANALIAEGSVMDAVYILRPLAYNPHGGAAADAARQMIAEALSSK